MIWLNVVWLRVIWLNVIYLGGIWRVPLSWAATPWFDIIFYFYIFIIVYFLLYFWILLYILYFMFTVKCISNYPSGMVSFLIISLFFKKNSYFIFILLLFIFILFYKKSPNRPKAQPGWRTDLLSQSLKSGERTYGRRAPGHYSWSKLAVTNFKTNKQTNTRSSI